jgi:hypothetical protein
VLHGVARGYVLAGQGIGRGLAEHWLSLKFCEALYGNRAGAMDLTDTSRSSESWYKGQVGEDDLAWFGQLLARTAAAGLSAFSGGGQNTAQYLTARQGREHYNVPTFAATSSVDDADIEVDDTKFVGTDHVFRMGSARIEAFSGMAEDLYGLIKEGRVEEYRQAAYELHRKRPRSREAGDWNGPISFHADGTVMALSILPIRRKRPL